jgi:hypothetical protein
MLAFSSVILGVLIRAHVPLAAAIPLVLLAMIFERRSRFCPRKVSSIMNVMRR